MCGPSGQEEQLAGEQASFASTLQANYATQFGAQSSILSSLNNAMSPIVAAGPNQQGFSAQELSTLNTSALNNGAAAARNAEQSTAGALAGRGGGGSSGLMSGVDQQIKAGVASNAAGQTAGALNSIQQQDYATGRANFFQAVGGQQTLAGLYAPSQYAQNANTGTGQAFQDASSISEQQGQEEADIAGGITSVAEMGLSGGFSGLSGLFKSAPTAGNPNANVPLGALPTNTQTGSFVSLL